MTFKEFLVKHEACSAAVSQVGNRPFRDIYREWKDFAYAEWLLSRAGVSKAEWGCTCDSDPDHCPFWNLSSAMQIDLIRKHISYERLVEAMGITE